MKNELEAAQQCDRLAGVELQVRHHCVKAVQAGSDPGSSLRSGDALLRGPLTWGFLRAGRALIPCWGFGGRILWLNLCITSLFFAERRRVLCPVTKEKQGIRI